MFSRSICEGVLVSSMEFYVVTETDLQRMASTRDTYARRLLGREGWGATRTDTRHFAVSKLMIRRKLDLHIV